MESEEDKSKLDGTTDEKLNDSQDGNKGFLGNDQTTGNTPSEDGSTDNDGKPTKAENTPSKDPVSAEGDKPTKPGKPDEKGKVGSSGAQEHITPDGYKGESDLEIEIVTDYKKAVDKNIKEDEKDGFCSNVKVSKVTEDSSNGGKKVLTTVERFDRLEHYEKLYRCYIEARRVCREITAIIAVSAVLIVLILSFSFGPYFRERDELASVNSGSVQEVEYKYSMETRYGR